VRLGGADIDGALVMIPAFLAMSADGRKRVIIRFGAESTNGITQDILRSLIWFVDATGTSGRLGQAILMEKLVMILAITVAMSADGKRVYHWELPNR
jgi:hypothetical protein